MDIYDIHKKHGFSIRTLRSLDKLGLLNCTANPSEDMQRGIKNNIRAGRSLSAPQLVYLAKLAKLPKVLSSWELEISDAMDAMGDYKSEAMEDRLCAEIYMAAKRVPASVKSLGDWIRRFIDTNRAFADGAGQPHGYIALRMLYNSPDNFVEENARLIRSAIFRIRQLPEMAGYWSVQKGGNVLWHRQKKFDL